MNRLLWIFVFTFTLNVFSNTLPPTLSNFRIEKNQPSRVYFDSSEEITASNTKGFIIGYKTISGINIISGKTTGHYFTVSKAFNFWDNDLIRYDGGSNLQDNDKNELNDFTLQYIQNNIPEPSGNGEIYYVSTSGNNSNNGLSQNKPWRTITYAATKARAGDIVYIKAGDYGKENIVIRNDGKKSNPIKFIGYKSNINDNPKINRSVGMRFLSSEMPLLKSGKGIGLYTKSKEYLIIRNIQIDGYSDYGIQLGNSSYTVLDNVYVQGGEFAIRTVNANGTNNRVINSYVANTRRIGIRLDNKNNLIDNVWVVSSKVASLDYYITVYGGNSGGNNTVRNCYINRYINDSHTGHGVSFKGGDPSYLLQHSLIENCEIIGVRGSIEFRHSIVQYNVARNITIIGKGSESGGLKFQDGANHNIAENCSVSNTSFGIKFFDTYEDPSNISGEYNKIYNCVFNNVDLGITGDDASGGYYNEISNNVFNNINTFTRIRYPFGKTNKLINNIIVGVKNKSSGSSKIDMTFNNFWNNGFSKPSGTGNIAVNPKFKNPSKGDFRLESTSKLIDAGKKINYIKLDFDGSNRPRGSSHDIGAFEYNDDSSNKIYADAGEDVEICKGESITLTASGGTSYSWSTGENTKSITVKPLSTKTYKVTAFNGGISDNDDVIVTVINVKANAGSDKTINKGENVVLTASGGGTYKWSTGETSQSIMVSPNSNKTYTVTVSKNGCEDNDSVKVSVNSSDQPNVIANAGEDVDICKGESTILTASGGTSYEWSTGETTQSITVNPSSTKTYSVTAFNESSSDVDKVIVNVLELSAHAGANRTIELGESTKLRASGGDTFKWSTGETTQNINVSPKVNTRYTVIVYRNGCEAEDSVKVTVNSSSPDAVIADAGEDLEICKGESTVLTAFGGSSYKWNTGESTQSITVSPSKSEIYEVTVYDGDRSGLDDVLVAVIDVTAHAGSDRTIEIGNSTKLTASGGDTYLWSTGEKTKSISVSPDKTKNYTVTVYKNGCSNTDKVKVTVIDVVISNPPPVEAFAGDDISICLGESVTLNASGGDTYSWSTGDDQEDIRVNPSRTTTYTLKADNGGVISTDSVVVTVENCNISAANDELENVFDIYPNPATGILNVDITGSENDLNLILVSVNGSIVYKDIISTKNTAVSKQVDLSRFAKGIYFVRLFNADENFVKKLLII